MQGVVDLWCAKIAPSSETQTRVRDCAMQHYILHKAGGFVQARFGFKKIARGFGFKPWADRITSWNLFFLLLNVSFESPILTRWRSLPPGRM